MDTARASSSISKGRFLGATCVADCTWEIPISAKPGMQVPARIFATESLLEHMDRSVFEQATNVACLPGIVRASLCMPDAHSGYGFPIGGVAAFRPEDGVISPGGIGFDINCGMRVIRTNLMEADVRPRLHELVQALFRAIPTGVGCKGFVGLSREEFRKVMIQGSRWCVEHDLGWPEDPGQTEGGGCLPGADPAHVSDRAVARGRDQLGTLGSGNHYLEVQVIPPGGLHDPRVGSILGFERPGQVFLMLHCGSRGFGHQIGTDYLRVFDRGMARHGISVPDRQLACAPFRSPEGRSYFGAMLAAANVAFANRQVITHRVREVMAAVFGQSARELDLRVIYDVSHNTAKLERHEVNGRTEELLVHRKGATRAFGPGAPDLPAAYREIGQPVIIGGSMETGSAVLVGTGHAMEATFGSTAHGSGRTMSRTEARRRVVGRALLDRLEARGIVVRAASLSGVAEEAGLAYKDVNEVVDVLHRLDLSRKVVSLTPIGNIKG
jgi:tRNA-splicing ligase RtcB (3'-phosphate/5'-hydroxy nucleic acid ligase)